jgi:glutaredoxin
MLATTERRALITAITIAAVIGVGWSWWRSRAEVNLGSQLAEQVRPGELRMLSSTTCPFCAAARAWLTTYRVAYAECFIERDPECAQVYAATGARGTPTLLVRGQTQLGFDPQRIAAVYTALPRRDGTSTSAP